MALPDSHVIQVGTQIIFADHATDFVGGGSKTSLEVATATDVQMTFEGLVDTAGRESAKADLGASRAPSYSVMASIEFQATPTTGEALEFYWAPSPISTAANGNPMSIDGVDAAASSGVGTLAELIRVCQFIGKFICTNDVAIQTAFIGTLVPTERYGILIIVNESGATLEATPGIESHVVFNPNTQVTID